MDIEKTLQKIVEAIKTDNPQKIILFGSFANGNTHEDCDIDLLVVLDTDSVSRTFREHMYRKLLVRNAIDDIEEPVDLIVYTKTEYFIVMKDPSSFTREIHESGRIIYENAG